MGAHDRSVLRVRFPMCACLCCVCAAPDASEEWQLAHKAPETAHVACRSLSDAVWHEARLCSHLGDMTYRRLDTGSGTASTEHTHTHTRTCTVQSPPILSHSMRGLLSSLACNNIMLHNAAKATLCTHERMTAVLASQCSLAHMHGVYTGMTVPLTQRGPSAISV